MPSPVINTTTSALRGLQSLCAHALGVAFSPVPMLTSADADGTLFLAPLAYLAATLLTALYFGQLWLLALSAFGVVWIDTQMAWRAQQIGKAKMERYMREQQLQLQNPSATVTAAQHAAEPPEPVALLPEAEPDAGQPPHQQPRQDEDSEEGEWEDEDEVDVAAPTAELTVLRSHIATATLCGMPAPALQSLLTPQQEQRLQADMDMALVIPDQVQDLQEQEHRHHQQTEAGHYSRREQLQTVPEEEAISAADDCSTLMHEMEAIKNELARVLSQRAERAERCLPPSPPSSVPGDEEEEEEEEEVAPLALPTAAAATAAIAATAATAATTATQLLAPLPEEELEEAPALPEDDDSLCITSMEQLDEPVSCTASLSSFGDFVEAPVGAGQDFSRPPSTIPPPASAVAAAVVGPGKKEQPHFPIIDDVLCEYEASQLQPQSQHVLYDHDHEEGSSSSTGSSSGDESRHDGGSSGDESGCQSPASSASSVCSSHGDDDVDAHPLDRAPKAAFLLDAPTVSPTEAAVVQQAEASALSAPTGKQDDAAELSVQADPPATSGGTAAAPGEAVVTTRRRQPVHAKQAPRKNNGWKRVPIKARLSPSDKQRFLSRPSW